MGGNTVNTARARTRPGVGGSDALGLEGLDVAGGTAGLANRAMAVDPMSPTLCQSVD